MTVIQFPKSNATETAELKERWRAKFASYDEASLRVAFDLMLDTQIDAFVALAIVPEDEAEILEGLELPANARMLAQAAAQSEATLDVGPGRTGEALPDEGGR
jgi:hypothetical protein